MNGPIEASLPSLRSVTAGNRLVVIQNAGWYVLRYGLVFLLLLFGTFKFFRFEAEGIQPLIQSSPFMSWLYGVLSVQGVSNLLGIVEVATAIGIALRRFAPAVSGYASLVAAGVFVVTLSFLFTTPGALAAGSPFGGFLLKDVILLGAALAIAGEALAARASRLGH